MGSVIALLASQALALSAPATDWPAARGAQASAAATVEILHAETTREAPGPLALKRQRRAGPAGQVSIEFE